MDKQELEELSQLNDVSHTIIGAAIEVHRHLGPGLLENIYEQAFVYELRLRGLAVKQQLVLPVYYKDIVIRGQRLDLLVEDKIVVEAKAVKQIVQEHKAQLLSYLKSTRLKLGLLINFHEPKLVDGVIRMLNA